MLKRKKIIILLSGILVILTLLSLIPNSSKRSNITEYPANYPRTSASLEGSENINVIYINREAELSKFGIVNIIDTLTFKNLGTNPINSILIGIPLEHVEDLIFFEAIGAQENTLTAEYTDDIINEYEMIAIYFESPLYPVQTKEIKFIQSYKDMLLYYEKGQTLPQYINYTGPVLPVLPYQATGTIKATYELPPNSQDIEKQPWIDQFLKTLTYEISSLSPFLENLVNENKATIRIVFTDNTITKLEAGEVNREIYINPFGIIKVIEEYTIRNSGHISIDDLSFEIPGPAKTITVFDELGEILGVTTDPEEDYFNLTYKDLDIDLSENRVKINPDTKYTFSIQYFLPFEKYISINWFQESFEIDVLTSIYEFLGKDQVIKIIIEGCFSLESVSDPPDAIEYTENSLILVYMSDYVSPLERKKVQFTFTMNYFDIILRPFILILLVALIASAYVLIIKSKKEEAAIAAFRRELLPINDIREFCSLIEEKNALFFEIRQAEEDVKRKKIIKKKYKNIVNKNNAKIQEIEKEIIPFKKIVLETNLDFENIVKKIDLLEAERESVKDSLNLLETRYKRGRLPSKAAYMKLSDNFLRRQKKIDRTMDKTIQQLRGYLL